MRSTVLVALTLLSACRKVYVPAPVDETPPPMEMPDLSRPECQIASDQEHAPGWPFDLRMFREEILPLTIDRCGMCHAPPSMSPGYVVWPEAAPGNCAYAQSFNSMQANVDLANPTNSPLYSFITGGDPAHPLQWAADDPRSVKILEFITTAAELWDMQPGAPVQPPPPPASPFDYAVFETVIQPIIDGAADTGCSNTNCHGADRGIGGFKVNRAPAAGTPEMIANFDAVTSICDLTAEPEVSKFYLQATNAHANGTSVVVSSDQAAAILDWIATAKDNAPNTGNPGSAACPGADNFDLATFTAEIEPILLGEIDLNDRTDTRVTTGCARTACHGQDRTGGALVLKATNTPAQNLEAFACFVNFTNPTASDILACPSNLPSCSHAPHPGDTIFANPADKNYQRILSFLYAAKTAATPLDFAFFTRRINPIFNDPSAIAGGAQNRTCADCHGVAVVGQSAPNGSNFPMIANASDEARLAFNFSSSANFVNVIQAEGSSLFLYPTNEIANLDNPFATGLPHPGGAAFAIDSRQAIDILTWARGLRPNADGNVDYFLVAGDYSGTQITDPTAVDETNVTPAIFDPSGASFFNDGKWDGLFAVDGRMDLNLAFPRPQTAGRIAYAVAYILNGSANDIQSQVVITSPNAVKLYVDKQPVMQADDATNGVTGLAVFPSYQQRRGTTRILLKVLQRADDPEFAFTLRLLDQFGNVLSDTTGELVIKLGPNGGI
jgi:hypothetical protein